MLPTTAVPANELSPEQGDELMFALDEKDRRDDRPDGEAAAANAEPTTLALVELLLKSPATVDRLNREPWRQRELFPRLLLIALTSYLVYALLMVLILNLAPAAAYPHSDLVSLPRASWNDGSAWAF